MFAVTEHVPVGLDTILAPPSAGRVDDRLAGAVGETDTAWFPSCRTAIRHALTGAGIGADDEVVLPGYTCHAVDQVVRAVATPVYVDVTPTGVMDPDAVAEAISPATAAVLPTHLWGYPCDVERIAAIAEEHDLLVLEDAAQALGNAIVGETVGRYSDCCTFSFRFYKETTAYTGGLLVGQSLDGVTDVPDHRLRLAAVWAADRGLAALPGRVYQALRQRVLDPLAREESASAPLSPPVEPSAWTHRILDVQLETIPDRVATRRRNADVYREALPAPLVPPGGAEGGEGGTYFRYPIRVPDGDRDALLADLRREGIGCSPMYAYTVSPTGVCPTADRLAETVVNLPVHAGLGTGEIEQIADTVETCWESVRG